MSSTQPRQVISKLFQGFVFVIGAVGVALTVWLWDKRRLQQAQLPPEKENSSDSIL